jgi:hypothetical protein
MNNLVLLRTMITLLVFIESYKKHIHLLMVTTFLDSGTIYKCEGGFYNASQILADKNININFPLYSTLITLKTKDIILIINYYKTIKVIKNIESNLVE